VNSVRNYNNMKKVYFENLGCWKNTVDAENILTYLCNNNFSLSFSPEESDLIIINTCGFILPAQQESYDTIAYYNEFKKEFPEKKIIVYGCLNSIKKDELINLFKNIDAFYKLTDKNEFLNFCLSVFNKDTIVNKEKSKQQIFLTPLHLKMLKISDGCDNKCSYCLIPKIRGKLLSRDISDIIKDFNLIKENELIKEVVLLGQDTANYGSDINMKNGLSILLRKILKTLGNKDMWLRIMYMHPKHFDFNILNIMKDDERICRYFDMPIQHTENKILKAMNRGYTQKDLFYLFDAIRKVFPDIVFRTTVIVGHPEETNNDFKNMLKFLEKVKPDYIGVFDYSLEMNAPDFIRYKNYSLPKNIVSKKNKIFLLQNSINQCKSLNIINKNFKVLIDGVRNNYSYARTSFMAPDIDNYVVINKKLNHGSFYNAKLLNFTDSYFSGEVF
jgi:ribosomal protein S12 methylthiotransferase